MSAADAAPIPKIAPNPTAAETTGFEFFIAGPKEIVAPPNRRLTLLLGQVPVAASQTISVECCRKTASKRLEKADQAEVRTRDGGQDCGRS